MNAIDLLEIQHTKVKHVLERMSEGELSDPAEIEKLANELVAHMMIEEHVFYPRIRQIKADLVEEGFEEHAVARFELARLIAASPEDRKTRATVLKELIEHHVKEEEQELFPKVRATLPTAELMRLGVKMETMFEKGVALGYAALIDSSKAQTIVDSTTGGRSTRAASAEGSSVAASAPMAQAR